MYATLRTITHIRLLIIVRKSDDHHRKPFENKYVVCTDPYNEYAFDRSITLDNTKSSQVKSSQVKMFIGLNIQMSITKHNGGKFNNKTCTKRRKVCIENMVIVLQNNCTTNIMRILLIGLTSITIFTYNNITLYLYNVL